MTLKEMRQTRICGEQDLNMKEKGMLLYMLLYEQVFGDVFERRESKCRAVLMKHCHKVKVNK